MHRIAYFIVGLTANLLLALALMAVLIAAACAIEGRIDVGTTPPRSPCPQAEP